MLARNLSRSRLRRLFSPSPLSTYYHTNTSPFSNSSHSLLNPSSSLNPPKTLPFFFFANHFSSEPLKTNSLTQFPLTRDGNYDETSESTHSICPGCGITMQDVDPAQPGFFIQPCTKSPTYNKFKKMTTIDDETEISDLIKRGLLNEVIGAQKGGKFGNADKVFDEMSTSVEDIESGKSSERPKVCARCHSLRFYTKVKNPNAENLLPDFDFDHTVGRRLVSVGGARTVVLMVVDATDFDGSFPRKVASLVSRTIDEHAQSWTEGKSGNVPRIMLVVTKIDLLPTSISPSVLEQWVRTRAREGGASKVSSLHLVSALKEWGIRTLVDDVVKFAGERGNVWAVGAQNAGKSTLINAIGKFVGTTATHLTEAPVAGTTLGIVRVEGVLPGRAKLFDTPGLLHSHQMSTRLTMEENRLVNIKRELKPRTYRIKAGHSIHIGGLLRLDVEKSSVDSIYVTVWASHLLPLHMGKTENTSKLMEDHFGLQLQPPIGAERVKELGKWVRKEFHVGGNHWDFNSVDIAAAGLGWFAIGLKGEAWLGVWTYDGAEVVVRRALLPRRSRHFEVAGFTVSDVVSEADRAQSGKQKSNAGFTVLDVSKANRAQSGKQKPKVAGFTVSDVVSKADRAQSGKQKPKVKKQESLAKAEKHSLLTVKADSCAPQKRYH